MKNFLCFTLLIVSSTFSNLNGALAETHGDSFYVPGVGIVADDSENSRYMIVCDDNGDEISTWVECIAEGLRKLSEGAKKQFEKIEEEIG